MFSNIIFLFTIKVTPKWHSTLFHIHFYWAQKKSETPKNRKCTCWAWVWSAWQEWPLLLNLDIFSPLNSKHVSYLTFNRIMYHVKLSINHWIPYIFNMLHSLFNLLLMATFGIFPVLQKKKKHIIQHQTPKTRDNHWQDAVTCEEALWDAVVDWAVDSRHTHRLTLTRPKDSHHQGKHLLSNSLDNIIFLISFPSWQL